MSGPAAIVGYAELPALKLGTPPPRPTSLALAADLGMKAVADAGLSIRDVDGISIAGLHESQLFVPSTVVEYLGIDARFADAPDLGGATPAAMIARAAMAIAGGHAQAVLCLTPAIQRPAGHPLNDDSRRFGASSYRPGSPQAEFEIPYGHLGQNVPYALIAQRYGYEYGYDARALARLVVHQRRNANRTPGAIFESAEITEDDVLASKMVARPLRKLEIVMPVQGGSAVLLVAPHLAAKCRHRPVEVIGHGERTQWKSPHYTRELLKVPIAPAAQEAFAMAGLSPGQVDMAQIYDCYSITVMLALESAGFCGAGEGMAFLRDHDMTWAGDFPLNTNGGQLGYGQAGWAGGMCHVIEGARQIMGRAGDRQIPRHDSAFVMGNGGIMSEQVALVLRGA